MVKVSIIVPVYNTEKYLRECLDSLVGQTLKDIEIIAVNDGSQDNSLRILEEYGAKDERIKIINQENAGPSAVRNRGIGLATGEFVGFVDSDDWVSLDFYEKLYLTAVSNGADIAYGGIATRGAKKDRNYICPKKVEVFESTRDKLIHLLKSGQHCYVWNKIYNREKLVASEITFLEGRTYEDMFWSPKIIELLGKSVSVPDVFYYYRCNMTSIVNTTMGDEKKMRDFKEAISFRDEFMKKYEIKKEFCCRHKVVLKFLGVPIIKIRSGDGVHKFYILGIKFVEIKIK